LKSDIIRHTGAKALKQKFFLSKACEGISGLGGTYQSGKTESGNKVIAFARCDAFEMNTWEGVV
jgi:hypothetical protein